MPDLTPSSDRTARFRRKIFLQRLSGYCSLAALIYLGWKSDVFLVLFMGVIAISMLPELIPSIAKWIGFGAVGAMALAGWCALLVPAGWLCTLGPSFETLVRNLRLLSRWVAGWPADARKADTDGGSSQTHRRVQFAMAVVTVITGLGTSLLLRDPLALLLLAAVLPLLGIASFRLLVAFRTPLPEDRAEPTVLVFVCTLAVVLIIVFTRERARADAEVRLADGLKAGILAAGMEEETKEGLQDRLWLSILAHQIAPLPISSQALRRAVDALPRPLAALAARRRDDSGREQETIVETIGISRTGTFVAGATNREVHVWAKAGGGEIGRFDCPSPRGPLRFSGDEALLTAACDRGASLRVFDAGARRERFRLPVSDPAAIRISPDSRFLAAVQGNNCVRVFDLTSGAPLSERCGEGAVLDLVFDRDGRRLAIARAGKTIGLDFVELAPIRTPSMWTPAAAAFAVVTAPGEVTVYDWQSGRPRRTVAHPGVTEALVSADGTRLVTVSSGRAPTAPLSTGEITVWRLADGREEHRLPLKSMPATGVEISDNGQSVAWHTDYYTAHFWRVEQPLAGAEIADVGALALSGEGRFLATAFRDLANNPPARLWSIATEVDAVLPLPAPDATRVRLDDRARRIVAIYADRVLLLDPETAAIRASIPEADITEAYVAPDARYALTVDREHRLALWSLADGRVKRILRDLPRRDWECPVAFAPDAAWIAIDTCKGRLVVVGTSDQPASSSLNTGSRALVEIVVSSDGRLLATNDNETLNVFEAASGRTILTLRVPQWQGVGHAAIAFRPDSHALIVASTQQPSDPASAMLSLFTQRDRVSLWDTDRRSEMAHFYANRVSDPDFIAIGRDGAQLAVANMHNGPIEIWRFGDPAPVATIDSGAFRTAVFSDDGRYLVTISTGGTLKVWATDSGTEIDRPNFTDVVSAAVWGRHAVTVSTSGEIRRWAFAPRDLVAAGCARLYRRDIRRPPDIFRTTRGTHPECPALEDS